MAFFKGSYYENVPLFEPDDDGRDRLPRRARAAAGQVPSRCSSIPSR